MSVRDYISRTRPSGDDGVEGECGCEAGQTRDGGVREVLQQLECGPAVLVELFV